MGAPKILCMLCFGLNKCHPSFGKSLSSDGVACHDAGVYCLRSAFRDLAFEFPPDSSSGQILDTFHEWSEGLALETSYS